MKTKQNHKLTFFNIKAYVWKLTKRFLIQRSNISVKSVKALEYEALLALVWFHKFFKVSGKTSTSSYVTNKQALWVEAP